MITIKIGSSQREFSIGDIDERWIAQQVARQKKDGPVCVRIIIRAGVGIDMELATAGCPKSIGSRAATTSERSIFELWHEQGLDDDNFSGGTVVSFLKKLRRFL